MSLITSYSQTVSSRIQDKEFLTRTTHKTHSLRRLCFVPAVPREMGDIPRYIYTCLQTGQLALLAILVSAGIVLQILACALYNNWWPMLTVIMYVLLPMPLMFFTGSSSSLMSGEGGGWIDFTKFLTGISAVGSIAIPSILKHADVIGWGALAMDLSSFFIFVFAILCYLKMNNDGDEYRMF